MPGTTLCRARQHGSTASSAWYASPSSPLPLHSCPQAEHPAEGISTGDNAIDIRRTDLHRTSSCAHGDLSEIPRRLIICPENGDVSHIFSPVMMGKKNENENRKDVDQRGHLYRREGARKTSATHREHTSIDGRPSATGVHL
ncbi:hypothetical protein NM688_g2859 [Phlebia brevispora]|uniref:Uncharacterized protein n=1 Tax=Phlebia brevispora TaxID=194682 RepID=A0ACC1T7K8_9APHY|nr:hypothetical protein NM688_g2859 [Phlebia brevispora]